MSFDSMNSELSSKEQDLLRFLIRDQAFSVEFLVTAIQEYYQHNRVAAPVSGTEGETK